MCSHIGATLGGSQDGPISAAKGKKFPEIVHTALTHLSGMDISKNSKNILVTNIRH